MAHTPTSMQTKLSQNAQLHFYVGSAPFHKAGIMLYNPKTKQTINIQFSLRIVITKVLFRFDHRALTGSFVKVSN